MIAWLNIAVLVMSSLLALYFYVRSVSPASLERKIGAAAYVRCFTYRIIASVMMCVMAACFVLYRWFPLPVPVARHFPWPWWISAAIGIVIGLLGGGLMWRGMRDAGEETMRPRKEHEMYEGIYRKIRHPQALGELVLWWTIAFLLDSPFLALFSLLYIPVWILMCIAEEKDLLLRYGDAYRRYQNETGFWWPKRGRMRNS
jgi:protein-S-isoprenylcysteine O-methyltransferase Ste14